MVVNCCAFGCKQKFVKGGPVTFHQFPKDEARRKLWMIRVRRKNFTPTNFSKICSKHFTDDCFETTKFGGTWLKSTAVPTLFEFLGNMDKRQKSPEKQSYFSIDEDESLPSSSVMFERRKRLYYLGDFRDDDVVSPTQARKVLQIAQEKTCEYKKKIKCLENENRKLKKQIASINELLHDLKAQGVISDVAHSALERVIARRRMNANLVQQSTNGNA